MTKSNGSLPRWFLVVGVTSGVILCHGWADAQDQIGEVERSRSIEPPPALIRTGQFLSRGAHDNWIFEAFSTELGLTTAQVKDQVTLETADRELENHKPNAGGMSTPDQTAERCYKRLVKILDARQLDMAIPLYLQLEGPGALEFTWVADRFQLSPGQRGRVTKTAALFKARHEQIAGGLWVAPTDRYDPEAANLLRFIVETIEDEDRRILEVLTPQQRSEWSKAMNAIPQLTRKLRKNLSSFSCPSFSPNGRFLLFQGSWSLNAFVAIADLEKGTATRLTPSDCWSVFPRFSPDGKSIVFSSDRDGKFFLYTMDLQGQALKRVVDGDFVADEGAAFSPDGQSLVFGTRDSGIYTVRRDGTECRRINFFGHRPWFSPDGTEVIYQKARMDRRLFDEAIIGMPPHDRGIGIAGADGRGERTLTVSGFDPVFSPDGRRIAFVDQAKTLARSEICLASNGGFNPVKLVEGAGHRGDLSFTPDGRKLLYWESDFSWVGGDFKLIDLATKQITALKIPPDPLPRP